MKAINLINAINNEDFLVSWAWTNETIFNFIKDFESFTIQKILSKDNCIRHWLAKERTILVLY